MLKLFQKSRISVKFKIVCLRPKKDFTDNGVKPPSIFDVIYFEKFNANSVKLIQNADVLILPAVGKVIDINVFEKSSIKLIQVTGAGFDRVDEKKLRNLNINVCNVTGVNSNSVAEYCIGNAITLLRSIKIADKLINLGKFSEVRKQIIEEDLFELQGLNACFIGLGPIGACVAGYFHKFGCKIFCNDIKSLQNSFLNNLGAKQITLEEVFKIGDIISIHLPLNHSTKNLINRQKLNLMKSNAILINASRGGIINENDLAKALLNKKIRGAVLDVFKDEPIKKNNPLLNLPEEIKKAVILTPHIAGVTKQSWNYLFKESWQNVENFLNGKPLKYLVN